MKPLERLQDDLKAALRAGDKLRLSTVRLLLTAVKNEAIRSGGDVDETAFVTLVQRAIKQRHEAAEQYRAGRRAELADKEDAEAEILAGYLPAQLSEEEIRAEVAALVRTEGLAGPKALGRVMGTLMPRFAGRTDGATLQRIAREVLAAGD